MGESNIPGAKALAAKTVSANLWTRRDFFGLAGWGAFLATIGAGMFAFLRMLFPRVLFEPSPLFKAGRPSDYVAGEVDERYKDDQRVWIVREGDEIYALLAICTHLGCTPRWLNLEGKFKCPCHGSGFKKTGVNFEGPAPRPLERLKISLSPEGEILIDKSKSFLWEKDQWDNPEARIKV